ncbi:MAG: hypothetical protein IKR23_03545 [Lachnospiraceae bacterium]|nr:hypothetical protein [Lachnospiraceae bacterium]
MELLKPIEYGTIPDILFIGNGINISYGGSSWDRVLAGLSTGEFDYDHYAIRQLPYSLQTIVISSDSVSDGMGDIAKELMPRKLCNEHSELLRGYLALPFDAILTTNYSYEIEVAENPEFNLSIGKASRYRITTKRGSSRQDQFGIYKYIKADKNNIWHIHGEAARPKSMVMGHYYYGRLLAEIQERVPEVIRSYKVSLKNKTAYQPKSWIDYFLISNVHIVGFGMDASEMDVWWLINCKKRNFRNYGKIHFYEPNLDNPNKYALKALTDIFNIECYTPKVNKSGYKKFYHDALEAVRENIRK